MNKTTAKQNVILPKKVLHNFLNHFEDMQTAYGELEDYLLMQNKDLVSRLKRARADDFAGQTRPLSTLLD